MIGDRCLVALDIDPRHNGDESLAVLLAEHGELPETPMCCTGGGGQHIFMWAHKAIPNSAGRAGDGRFGEGVDVRGEGGYVIASPSRHESGRTYEWDSGAHPSEIPLAEAPPWFVHLAGWSKKRREAYDGNDVGNNELYIIGGRNSALMRLGGAMRRVGAGLKRITDALLDENEEKCSPPLDPAEVKKIAKSAYGYESTDPSPEGVDPFPMLFASDLAKPLAPLPWVVEGLAIGPGVTIVGGAGFGGKTMAMQSLILSVVSGTKVWGQFECRQGKARHLDFEQGSRLTTERYQRLARAMGIDLASLPPDALGVTSLPKGRLDDKSAEDSLVRLLTGVDVALIDAFRGAFPTAKENDSESRKHLDMLQMVTERTGCAIIVIAHSRKPQGESEDDVRTALRGSGALFDAAQTVFMLNGMADKPTKVHNTKDRLLGKTRDTFGISIEDKYDPFVSDPRWGLTVGYVAPVDLGGLYSVSDVNIDQKIAMNAERLTSAANRIVSLMPPEGTSARRIATLLGGCGVNYTEVKSILDDMIQHGSVLVHGTGEHALYTLPRSREPGED
jgi:hypothetical protein